MSLNSLQRKILHNLENNLYAKLAVFDSNRIGFKAIKDIPPNTNPFRLTNNKKIRYDFVELTIEDVNDARLEPKIIDLLNLLFNEETQTYFIPFAGLNTMNIIMYIKKDISSSNLKHKIKSKNELYEFITTKKINAGEELIIPGFKFNVNKIRSSNSRESLTKKNSVIESLKYLFCKIGPTTIPNLDGVGVIAIKNIDNGVNIFRNTNDICYIYDVVGIPKYYIDNLTNEEVKKIVRDFITPNENLIYCIPYLGFNSLNLSFYLNHSNKNNLDIVSDNCEYFGFRTNKEILIDKELFINYAHYNYNFEELMDFTKL